MTLTTMPKMDLHRVLTRVPRDIVAMLKKSEGTLWLGGGYVRAIIAGEEPNDIDIFGTSKEQLEIVAEQLKKSREERKIDTRIHKTKNALTLLSSDGRVPVQFITRWKYVSIQEVCESFDFSICQAVVGYAERKWQSCISDRFYRDLAAKRLFYTDPIRDGEAGGSMMRVLKYYQRGYTIQTVSLGRVMARVVDGIRKKGIDEGATIDMSDTAKVGRVLGGLLAEVDPMLIVDGLDLVDDHETVREDLNDFSTMVGTHQLSGTGE